MYMPADQSTSLCMMLCSVHTARKQSASSAMKSQAGPHVLSG